MDTLPTLSRRYLSRQHQDEIDRLIATDRAVKIDDGAKVYDMARDAWTELCFVDDDDPRVDTVETFDA